MAIQLDISRSRKTKTRLVPALPRVKFSVDLMGYQLTWKQTPILETLLNMKKLKKGIMEIASMQFKEMDQRPSKKTQAE